MIKNILLMILLTSVATAQESVKFKVKGMTCGGCAASINENIQEDFPDYIVKADFDTKSMTVMSRKGKKIQRKALIEALDDMGFQGEATK